MIAKDLVLLGGGHSHVEVLRAFGQIAQRNRSRQAGSAGGSGHAIADGPGAGAGSTANKHPKEPHEYHQDQHRLTLISRGRFTPYSGMLPGWASGFYSYDDCHIDLQRLAWYAGARLVLAEAKGIDIWARTVRFSDVADGVGGGADGQAPPPPPPVSYDVLSIDVGITPDSAGVPGADQHATPVKPIDGFVQRYEQLMGRYRAAAAAATAAESEGGVGGLSQQQQQQQQQQPPVMRVCVVGGGAGGVELAAAVRYRLEEERRRGGWEKERASAAVSLVCRGGLLPGHPPHVRRLVRQLLAERGVEVRPGDAVTGVRPGELLLESGWRVPYDECLWCTEASPAAWLRGTGLPTDARGFLSINERLQSEGGPPEVFAAGDVASCAAHPRPKAGVYAVRQGPPLAANLRAALDGRPLQPSVPQEAALALISLGDRFCVASRTGGPSLYGQRRRRRRPGPSASSTAAAGGDGWDEATDDVEDEASGPEWPLGWLLNGFGGALVGVTGPLLWRWKDSIDRAFMRKYGSDLLAGAGTAEERR